MGCPSSGRVGILAKEIFQSKHVVKYMFLEKMERVNKW
jgi:hypothetical protein